MDLAQKVLESVGGAAAGIVALLMMAILWLSKERSRLLSEIKAEREAREALHERLHRTQSIYGKTLLGVAGRLAHKIQSR